MTVSRILVVAALTLAGGLDLALDGWQEHVCRQEIQRLREEIELCAMRLEIERAEFQAAARTSPYREQTSDLPVRSVLMATLDGMSGEL